MSLDLFLIFSDEYSNEDAELKSHRIYLKEASLLHEDTRALELFFSVITPSSSTLKSRI